MLTSHTPNHGLSPSPLPFSIHRPTRWMFISHCWRASHACQTVIQIKVRLSCVIKGKKPPILAGPVIIPARLIWISPFGSCWSGQGCCLRPVSCPPNNSSKRPHNGLQVKRPLPTDVRDVNADRDRSLGTWSSSQEMRGVNK